MAKYHNKKATRLIGKRIQDLRIKSELDVEDVAAITGFHRNTIISIEHGSNTDLSHIIEVAFALNLQPKVLLDINFKIKPRFNLPATRKEKNKLTPRITNLIKIGFFKLPKTSNEVRNELRRKYPESNNIETKNISVILKRQVENGKLKIKIEGRKYIYIKLLENDSEKQ